MVSPERNAFSWSAVCFDPLCRCGFDRDADSIKGGSENDHNSVIDSLHGHPVLSKSTMNRNRGECDVERYVFIGIVGILCGIIGLEIAYSDSMLFHCMDALKRSSSKHDEKTALHLHCSVKSS